MNGFNAPLISPSRGDWWDRINGWFFRLSMMNWGFPWHIVLAAAGMRLGFWLGAPAFLRAGVIFALGLIYETVQLLREESGFRDAGQDVVADVIGIIIGI